MEDTENSSEAESIDPLQFEVDERYFENAELESYDVYPTGWTIAKEVLQDFSHRLVYFYVPFNSKLFYFWSFLVSIGVLYNAFAMVIFIFADVKSQYFWNWVFCNILFDVVFAVDIFVQSRLSWVVLRTFEATVIQFQLIYTREKRSKTHRNYGKIIFCKN